MPLNANRVLELPILQSATLKTGENLLFNKSVEWISVIEMPVENFVRENEFVLTTGIGCYGDPELLEQFVKDVIQSGATVLGLATGRYIFDIPDRIIELAVKHEFIIIDIPWEVRFGDIMQMVLEEINQDNKSERLRTEEIRQELINDVLQNKGPTEIANALYKYIETPVVITDYTRQIKASKEVAEDTLTLFQNRELKPVKPTNISNMAFIEHPLYPHIEVFQVNGEPWYQILIATNHRKQGFLWFQLDSNNELSWFMMNVLEHTITAFALYFLKENAIEMTEIRLKDNFILQLAKQKNNEQIDINSKAELLGYNLDLTYICIVGEIRLKEESADFPKFKRDRPTTSSMQSLNYYIQKEITNAADLMGRKTMATFDEGEVIVYLETDHHLHTETANQFLDTIERRLNELLTEVELKWGIASQKNENNGFHNSYKEAKIALEIGKQNVGSGDRTFFKDTRINRLLMTISTDDDIMQIVKDTIEPLIHYDEKRQTDLVHTFMTYNNYKANVSQTARALNLHRQSLMYRLRNIESLTQLSLVNSDDVFLLELSIRLWMLRKTE
ncbi:PucR family transcriptional regulator [Salisediminibacterium beveridgei]|uniref:PucR family transcriptional regulator n=1 Tax=Salisediminibacterium beveridgei TaxID=632773 RepID=UPI00084807F7|nr:PucR family transcriptional regulator [Salisediminibacterium beveridgei]